jgi:hypothetical protein
VPARRTSHRACATRYEKYTKDENKDRLLNPGDAFSEACLDFQFQITALMEARAGATTQQLRARWLGMSDALGTHAPRAR